MTRCPTCGAAPDPSSDATQICARCILTLAVAPDTGSSPIEDDFGPYLILSELGSGGMAVVYLAEQQYPIRREVAIKVLKPGFDTGDLVARFETERQALALMAHPNIAQVYDAGTSSRGRPYIVMELVDGEPLTTFCDNRRLSLEERLALFLNVCSAVEHAHRKGILHRDLKPSNILVLTDNEPVPKVIDFGIAKALGRRLTGQTVRTEFGQLLGTPEYMSPELATLDQRDVGPASDLYSLGVVLYEVLTGSLPFDTVRLRHQGLLEAIRIVREDVAPEMAAAVRRQGATPAGLRRTHENTLIQQLSGDLSAIVHKCLEKDPMARYASVADLAQDIHRYLNGQPVAASAPGFMRRARKMFHKHRVRLGAVTALALAAVLMLAVIWMPRRSAGVPLDSTQLTAYAGLESAPSFSPDAKDVTFTWNGEREDNWDIYRLHSGDPSPQRLTNDPVADYSPVWSPDGKSIAYLKAAANRSAWVMLMPAKGGYSRQLARVNVNIQPKKRWLAWAPGSRWLVVANRLASSPVQAIFGLNADSGEMRALTNPMGRSGASDGQPSLSLDARLLMFARDAETNGQIWTVPLSNDFRPNGPERRITLKGFEHTECSVPRAISSREFLFLAPFREIRTMWRAPLDGSGTPRQLAELASMPTAQDVSVDGHKLVYSRERFDSNVWRIDLDRVGGKEVRRQKVLGSTRWDQNALLSPDGNRLAFESNRGGFPEIWQSAIDGSDATQLSRLNTLTSSPMWSPDGKIIAFHGSVNGHDNIFVIPAAGGQARNLTNHPAEDIQPVWSPDGKWIYFCSNRSGVREIWRMRAEGSEPQRITLHGGFDLAFSPDGQWIYFSKVRAPLADIWRMSPAGGSEELVLEAVVGGHVAVTNRGLYASRVSLGSKQSSILFFSFEHRTTATLATTDRLIKDRLAVSRDECSIYFTQVDDDGMDLMLVDDFH